MPAAKYFAYAAEILKLQPSYLTDQPTIARMKWSLARALISPGPARRCGMHSKARRRMPRR
jgi:hypothetical protein